MSNPDPNSKCERCGSPESSGFHSPSFPGYHDFVPPKPLAREDRDPVPCKLCGKPASDHTHPQTPFIPPDAKPRCKLCSGSEALPVHHQRGGWGHAFVADDAPLDPQPKASPAPASATHPELGDVVLYMLGHGPNAGELRPAMVIGFEKEPRAEHLAAFLSRIPSVAKLIEAPLAAALKAWSSNAAARALAVRLLVFTDDRNDGLGIHVAPAAFSETPLAWHYTPVAARVRCCGGCRACMPDYDGYEDPPIRCGTFGATGADYDADGRRCGEGERFDGFFANPVLRKILEGEDFGRPLAAVDPEAILREAVKRHMRVFCTRPMGRGVCDGEFNPRLGTSGTCLRCGATGNQLDGLLPFHEEPPIFAELGAREGNVEIHDDDGEPA
jgi:hypothetical protein